MTRAHSAEVDAGSATECASDQESGSSRVMVTGASGFLGSYLARRLLAEEVTEVHAVIRAATDPERVRRLSDGDAAGRLRLHETGIDLAGIRQAVARARPDTILHLASLNVSQHHPEQVEELVEANILMPALLLECLAEAGGGRFVNMGSAWQHFSGPDYDPVCLYAATKQSCESFLTYHWVANRIPSISLKLFHAYGLGDPRTRLLTLLCRAVITGETLPMSEGRQVVDYVHANDVVEAVLIADGLLAAEEVTGAAAFGIPSGHPLTVRDLVDLVGRVAGRPVPVAWGRLPYKPREIMQAVSCGPTLPGWRPRVPLSEGIARLLGDMRRHAV